MLDAKSFAVYEFAGVLAPGTLMLLGLGVAFPQLDFSPSLARYAAAGAAIFLIVAYVAGQLVQAVGNLCEEVVWRAQGGWPSDWPRSGAHHLLAPAQEAKLSKLADDRFGIKLRDATASDWRSAVRQIYAAVQQAGAAALVDRFNSNYGLMRGTAAATLTTALAFSLSAWPTHLPVAALFLAATGVAIIRMMRFGRYYAQELFVRFIALDFHPAKEGE